MLFVKQALKAIVRPAVDSLKAVVTRPLLSAFRHGSVSDWNSVKNTKEQEAEGRRVRRVRFASNAKKEGGVLHPYGVWLPSPTCREVGGEEHYKSMPSDYKDGNLDDWLQHDQEDLEKRASFWHLVKEKSPVFNECMALQRLLEKTQQTFWEMEDMANTFDPKAAPFHYDYYVCKKDAAEKEFYALKPQLQEKQDEFFALERKIDALDPEEGEEEPVQANVEELQENTSVEMEVPFEESVLQEEAEEGEEEPVEVHVEEVEELGSGFTTDAAGRVRRFSHRLKGKSHRVYKF